MELISIGTAEDYAKAIRGLFPPGEFWDNQFNDPESDIALYCIAKAEELIRFKNRSSDLLAESIPDTVTELIDDWERVMGLSNKGYPITTRRDALKSRGLGFVSPEIVDNIVTRYGAVLDQLEQPFFPAIFCFTRFKSRLWTPAAFNVVELRITMEDQTYRTDMEEAITDALLANHIIHFLYRTETDEYVP